MTILPLLLALAPHVDVSVALQLPIPTCEPELVGIDGKPLTFPPAHPLVFTFADTPVRLFIQSTCRAERWICLDYRVMCSDDCVWASGGRTAAKNETRADDSILFTVPMRCWGVTEQVVCRVEYEPSALSDMNGDCIADVADLRILTESRAWNRLAVFQSLQNELPISPGQSASWSDEWSGPRP